MKQLFRFATMIVVLVVTTLKAHAVITMEYATPRQVWPRKLCYDIDWVMWNDWTDPDDGSHHHDYMDKGTMRVGKDCAGGGGIVRPPVLGDGFENRAFDKGLTREALQLFSQQVDSRNSSVATDNDKQFSTQRIGGESSGITFSPNPSSGIFTVKGQIKSGTGWAVSVQDMTGKTVYHYSIPDGVQAIDLAVNFSSLPKGVYQATLTSAVESLPAQRLIIQ